jgi:hypothetical protein
VEVFYPKYDVVFRPEDDIADAEGFTRGRRIRSHFWLGEALSLAGRRTQDNADSWKTRVTFLDSLWGSLKGCRILGFWHFDKKNNDDQRIESKGIDTLTENW